MVSPLGAADTSNLLTEKEAAGFAPVLEQMNLGFLVNGRSYTREFQPKKIISRIENKKGCKTIFLAMNGSTVVIQNYGKTIVRFCA